MIRLTLLFLVTLLLGCSDKPKIKRLELSSDNHFKVALNEPIAYANVTADHIEVYIDVTISNAVLDLDKIKTDSLFTGIGSDKDIYNTFQSYTNSEEGKTLKDPKKILVSKVLDRFKHSGVNLSTKDLETYKRLSTEINELSTEYTTNIN
ncbi:hypothetical protein [uncultured Winogradskyella sp.]|uniref:hypothetical protein n=1 Tax=uncultured Winogradskyella sp. TaxID=395353 RepID=UPI0030D7180A|tara:strand:- start:14277 stop:14726 length:450 start_codon:yes stop_codon:yes gene_type:complete